MTTLAENAAHFRGAMHMHLAFLELSRRHCNVLRWKSSGDSPYIELVPDASAHALVADRLDGGERMKFGDTVYMHVEICGCRVIWEGS